MFDTSRTVDGISYEDAVRSDTLKALIEYGKFSVPVGGFLQNVLQNNLTLAVCKADSHNLDSLKHIVYFVQNELPVSCYGSREKYEAWLSKEGVCNASR